MHSLSIIQPDDWHVHFRDNEWLPDTVFATANHFRRALVMPNLHPPLTTIEQLVAYRDRIMHALQHRRPFSPYMTFYLNESVSPSDLLQIQAHPFILGAKLYPKGATTHSEQGVQSIHRLYPLLAILQANNWVLQIHGELADGDIFERESTFIETVLTPLLTDFPSLRIVLEHISTKAAVDFIKQAPGNIAATITAHHLYYNRNHLLAGGIKPHYYCLPILKHERDQQALQEAATSGNPKFFAGTDSAPHAQQQKENACGCAGIYSAPYALALYAEVFDALGLLDRLESFTSVFGANFYQLPPNETRIKLHKQIDYIPSTIQLGNRPVIPIGAGNKVQWRITPC